MNCCNSNGIYVTSFIDGKKLHRKNVELKDGSLRNGLILLSKRSFVFKLSIEA